MSSSLCSIYFLIFFFFVFKSGLPSIILSGIGGSGRLVCSWGRGYSAPDPAPQPHVVWRVQHYTLLAAAAATATSRPLPHAGLRLQPLRTPARHSWRLPRLRRWLPGASCETPSGCRRLVVDRIR